MRHAFSLVELSIVLVILGLLTGGILAGQSLIRASEIRAVTSEYTRYYTAVSTFRDKYFAIPGDMSNATKFWGRTVNAVDCVTNSSAAVATPGACDGNGGGTINGSPAASQAGERFQFWRHLANAGLIEGSYTGNADSNSATGHTPGDNCPASKITTGSWSPFSRGVSAGAAGSYFAADYGNELGYMGWASGGATAIIRPEEAWNIDTKLDDGKPGRGRILAYLISTCTDSGAAAGSQNLLDSNYLLTSTSIACGLFFVRQY